MNADAMNITCSECGAVLRVPFVIKPNPEYVWIPEVSLGTEDVRDHWATHHPEPELSGEALVWR